jgi:hypothetical protein
MADLNLNDRKLTFRAPKPSPSANLEYFSYNGMSWDWSLTVVNEIWERQALNSMRNGQELKADI